MVNDSRFQGFSSELEFLFTPSLLHSLIFDSGFLNVGEDMNKMGNSHETREIKSLVLTHSFLYTLVY